MPRHWVEPGAVIRHAAPLTVTKITPTPVKQRRKEKKQQTHLDAKTNWNHLKFQVQLNSIWLWHLFDWSEITDSTTSINDLNPCWKKTHTPIANRKWEKRLAYELKTHIKIMVIHVSKCFAPYIISKSTQNEKWTTPFKTLDIHYSSKSDQLSVLMTDNFELCGFYVRSAICYLLCCCCYMCALALFSFCISIRLKRPEDMNEESRAQQKTYTSISRSQNS